MAVSPQTCPWAFHQKGYMDFDIFQLAKQVKISDVIGRYVALKPHNGNYLCLCPFHNDRKVGSFVVFPKTNRFKCFACGEAGDAIDFVSQIAGISSYEAAVTIAADFNLITADELTCLQERKDRSLRFNSQKLAVLPKEQTFLEDRASAEHLHVIYKCFIAACAPLSTEFREVLLTQRKLSEDDLKDYFVFPQKQDAANFWPRFRAKLQDEFGVFQDDIQEKLLLGVPGFFLNNQMHIAFSAQKTPSLGITIHNRRGQISGIQVRNMAENQKKGNRYKLMSSAFADGTTSSFGSHGCNCGYVEDVLYPKGPWHHAIALTEGRFKAVTLSKMGFLVVNMHSISNWAPAGDVALALAGKHDVTTFVLVYDMEDNDAVYKSARNLYDKLSPQCPTCFAVWDPQYGKGIDDVVNAGHKDRLRTVSSQEFFSDAKTSLIKN